jgi:type III secretory pathway component EscV
MIWSTYSINNINISKKVLTQYEPPSTRIHAQRNTHDTTPQKYALQQHDDTQHRCSLTTLHDKCQHANSNTSQQHVTKNFMGSLYIHAVTKNNLYTMTSFVYNTSRQTFFSHDSTRPILGMRRRAFPDIVQNTLPQVTNQHMQVSPTNKNKST